MRVLISSGLARSEPGLAAFLKASHGASIDDLPCDPAEVSGLAGVDLILLGAQEEAVLPRIALLRAAVPQGCILAFAPQSERDQVAPLMQAGADDVACLPLCLPELDARIRRRLNLGWIADPVCAAISMLPPGQSLRLTMPGAPESLHLTPVEVEILRLLARPAGGIVTRNQLSNRIDGADWDYGDRKFDVHIAKIRRKLASACGDGYQVRTVRSEGYMLIVPTIANLS